MKKISYVLFSVVIIFSLTIIVLKIIGYDTYRVDSPSMAPQIKQNALAIIKRIDKDYVLEKEDIISFPLENKLALHKIEKIDGDIIITKGTANQTYDAPINRDEVIGLYVFSIPILGILFASKFPLIIITLSFFSYIIIVQIIKELKKGSGGK